MIYKDRFIQIKPLYDKLDREEYITENEIILYAKNLSTREILYELLINYNRAELFPKEFYTLEKSAEAHHRCRSAYSYGLTRGSHPNLHRTTTDEISVARP